eukprot:8183824-Pyramimonas_sp.AAC.1
MGGFRELPPKDSIARAFARTQTSHRVFEASERRFLPALGASGGPRRASIGPSGDASGCRAGPGERAGTSGDPV